ncbi:MAG: mercury methylation corrinoid protein HgcA [bacterium]
MDPFSQPFVTGRHQLAEGPVPAVPVVSTTWTRADRLGAVAVRWGIGRYEYLVEPGLYAIGAPDASAPVLVSANYKLSFDVLRRELEGQDVFVLVLETLGINVWCAAGKGTFGTGELCRRIGNTGLDQVVSHRRVIVPQLGAPGMAAHEVRRRTGFRVVYGPVEARDLPAFLASGRRATEAMRRKRFLLRDRTALVPMELVPALKYGLPLMAVLAVVAGFLGPGPRFLDNLASHGAVAGLAALTAVLCGAVLTPLLLPWIPGRAFAWKGALAALLIGVPLILGASVLLAKAPAARWADLTGLALLSTAMASFFAMNFTGSSTYTSLSGVERELRVAVPAQLALGVLGLTGWVLSISLWR